MSRGRFDVLDPDQLWLERRWTVEPRWLTINLIMAAISLRKLLKRLAPFMAGLLFFAQLSLAAQGCVLQPQSSPMQTAGDIMAMEGCAGTLMDETTCLVHCLKSDQPANPTFDKYFQFILPPVSTIAALPPLQQSRTSEIPSRASWCAGSPSLQILFCSFQN